LYLSDTDIFGKLPELNFDVSNKDHPFNPTDQIQPCSIDLRLGDVFWIPKKRWTIDLRKKHLLHLQPRRYYRRIVLKWGESVTINPGKLLLGRIHEKYTIPDDCAGNITGRSSFARLGLMVHCTGNFINPGWRGYMPLQLVNLGSNPIKIFPFLPICQLNLMRLTNIPQVLYGVKELHSKYMDDDGGPSYIWRDQRIQDLQSALATANIELKIQQRILNLLSEAELDVEVIERLEKKISRAKPHELENTEIVLDSFSKSEDFRLWFRQVALTIAKAASPLFVSLFLGSLFKKPITYWHFLSYIMAVISVPISIYAFRTEVGDHLDRKTLSKIRTKKEQNEEQDKS
jgi:deoxycytidine triphosphate deaminase